MKEKMHTCDLYLPDDEEIMEAQTLCLEKLYDFNATRPLEMEKRTTLFKPFAEVHDLTQGDGLGLPTCSLIAYKLNGTLRLDDEYKKGTRFILELHA